MAEGAGRQPGSSREFARYLTMAIGSVEEVRLWCRYGIDLGYVEVATAEGWREECRQIIRMLHGLKASVEGT